MQSLRFASPISPFSPPFLFTFAASLVIPFIDKFENAIKSNGTVASRRRLKLCNIIHVISLNSTRQSFYLRLNVPIQANFHIFVRQFGCNYRNVLAMVALVGYLLSCEKSFCRSPDQSRRRGARKYADRHEHTHPHRKQIL